MTGHLVCFIRYNYFIFFLFLSCLYIQIFSFSWFCSLLSAISPPCLSGISHSFSLLIFRLPSLYYHTFFLSLSLSFPLSSSLSFFGWVCSLHLHLTFATATEKKHQKFIVLMLLHMFLSIPNYTLLQITT